MLRPSAKVSAPGGPDDDVFAMSASATAAATNSTLTNKMPLPRNTVAKKRSSRSPIRSRSTPINHRKAIPANGTRLSAIATVCLGIGDRRIFDWGGVFSALIGTIIVLVIATFVLRRTSRRPS